MDVKVIRTETEYEIALAEIENLMDEDPESDSPDGERLGLLTLVVREYESEHYQIESPDPIEAIEFRMEQENLAPRDLIPYLGSRSKVSEVLARKRPLTLAMIRALSSGLGIPAKVLIGQTDCSSSEIDIDWSRFPFREMRKRGWFSEGVSKDAKKESLLREFFEQAGHSAPASLVLCRASCIRTGREMDSYALAAWTARVASQARRRSPRSHYQPQSINAASLRELVQLSVFDDAPNRARQFLADLGIVMVVERHLPGTYLDGATIITKGTYPIVGLTLRYDRIDNFWFTLMHELAHVALHIDSDTAYFFDNLDVDSASGLDSQENEADELARDLLIPGNAWNGSLASQSPSPKTARLLAGELGIHPAIVAGRMCYEFNEYRRFSKLVGSGEVRRHFPEVKWKT
jgi:HTH-type transcriptional regulator / antitoxin HigA